jgi:hypothetical protein
MIRLIRLFFKDEEIGQGFVNKDTLFCRKDDDGNPKEDTLSFFFLPPDWGPEELSKFSLNKRGRSGSVPWGIAYPLEILAGCGFQNFRYDNTDLADVYRNLHVVCECPEAESVSCLQMSLHESEIINNTVIKFIDRKELGILTKLQQKAWRDQPCYQQGYKAPEEYVPRSLPSLD